MYYRSNKIISTTAVKKYVDLYTQKIYRNDVLKKTPCEIQYNISAISLALE